MPRPARAPPERRLRRRATYLRSNRLAWDRSSDSYDRRHREELTRHDGMAWGLWRLPERELRLLGAVRGRRSLELGCGAARWSRGLARRGARAVGVDVSRSQLSKARRLTRRGAARVDLVHGSADRLPFRSRSFDLIFSDWGAMTFVDPAATVPEAARLLRPGGRLVFAASSPFRYVTWDRARDRLGRRLTRAYFDDRPLVLDGITEFTRTYGAWVELFRRHGFEILGLTETRPAGGPRGRYTSKADAAWARRWPMEALWSLRRRELPEPSGGRSGRRRRRGSAPPRP